MRSVRKQEQVFGIPLAGRPYSQSYLRPALRLWHWELIGRGGLVRGRIPNVLCRRMDLIQCIEDRAAVDRGRRIRAAGGTRDTGQDAVRDGEVRRRSLAPIQLSLLAIPREFGLIVSATAVAGFVAACWAAASGA